jgi:nucleolar protein 14
VSACRTQADGKRKTKREIMSELIAKSKFYKAERQKEKMEVEELTDKLDDAWRGLLKQGAFAGMVRNNRREDPVDMLMKSLERAKKGDKGLQIATSAAEAFDSMEGDNKVRRAARHQNATSRWHASTH